MYMKKLALYLSSRIAGHVRVGVAETVPHNAERDTVWIGSDEFLCAVREQIGEDARCIELAEEEGDDEAVYRYQSCEKLYQQIILRYRKLQGIPAGGNGSARQRWIVFTTDGSPSSLLAFSLTCAQILGERERTLYLNLSECSGMAELFSLEAGADLSDLASALRSDEPVCLEAYVRRMEQVDYILPPSNPMILPELTEDDVGRLIEAVGNRGEYGCVVIALGTACCGCDRFFSIAERLFHITRKGTLRECGRREWTDFISMCRAPGDPPPEQILVPQIQAESSGIHLIRAWQEGALGQLARIYMNGEEKQ